MVKVGTVVAIAIVGLAAIAAIVLVLVASMFIRQLVNNHPVVQGPLGRSSLGRAIQKSLGAPEG